ncbi:MAG TPA: HupE/UreJ family protein [Phycisphaerales bacterium]|nr:HupE/UreJ family protein [Phycisphaerales bacterium]
MDPPRRCPPSAGSSFAAIRVVVALCLTLLAPSIAHAHPVVAASAIVAIRDTGHVEITVHYDALAFALNDTPRAVGDQAMLDLLSGPRADLQRTLDEGRDRFARLFALRADDASVPTHVTIYPNVDSVLDFKAHAIGPVLPVKMDIVAEGDLPPGVSRIAMRFPEVMGDVVLTVAPPHAEALVGFAPAGEWCRDFVLPAPRAAAQADNSAPHTTGAVGFVLLGIFHILPDHAYFASIAQRFHAAHPFADPATLIPDGADHILFVLGLFFLAPRIKPLLFQVTAFTLAHSVTLALAAHGTITLSSSIVEPLIAASIAAVAIENLCTPGGKVHSWRIAIVFGFGLIHGLGFASAFKEAVGAERAPLVPVLLFNVGVELGQLAIIAAAMLAVGYWRNRPWYRNRIAVPASIFIAAVGLFWVVQRVFF